MEALIVTQHLKLSFHSLQALPVAWSKLGSTTSQGVSLPWDAVRDALDHMVQAAANYVDREHFLVLWDSLQVRFVLLLIGCLAVRDVTGCPPVTGQCGGTVRLCWKNR